MFASTAVGWTRWQSYAGQGVRQSVLGEDGKPLMRGDKILIAEKLDPVEYGGIRNDQDLGLCKSWFQHGSCDFDWFTCPFRHWKPVDCERLRTSDVWWEKHMGKFKGPLLPPDGRL
jgi:hypothetical protein